jgi:hypothetical protein
VDHRVKASPLVGLLGQRPDVSKAAQVTGQRCRRSGDRVGGLMSALRATGMQHHLVPAVDQPPRRHLAQAVGRAGDEHGAHSSSGWASS